MRSDSLRRHWRVKHNDFKVNTVRRGTDKDVSNTPSINDWRSEIVGNGTMLDEGKKLTISRHEEEEEEEEERGRGEELRLKTSIQKID